jgi:SH3-like domain-containing protein
MSNCYTVICEYRTGTYIAQVSADSPQAAILSWLSNRGVHKHIPKEARLGIKAELKEGLPVPITDCKNVWCHTTSARGGLILINVVLTIA